MRIYKTDGTYKDVILTKEAVHEEELMKSDFVGLSWVDAVYEVISQGSYIIPFEDIVDIEGKPARFTLYKDYAPSDTPQGYRYEPQFQHPKMWLRYVPFLYPTQDAAGNTVEKTEHNEVGRLSDIMGNIVGKMNAALGLSSDGSSEAYARSIMTVYNELDPSMTVSVMFSDTDLLGAVEAVTNVVGCEWHLDWQLKILYIGTIKTGVTPYPLVVDGNVSTPGVTQSKDIIYNRYLVQGSSRNVVRQTDHGWQATGTRLTLPSEYDGSIIDLRREYPHRSSDAIIEGRGGEPALTAILTLDDVYPHLDLYLYDVRERKKWKVDADGNITNERWSVWYAKLAYKDSQGAWHDYILDEDVSIKLQSSPIIDAGEDSGTIRVNSLITMQAYNANCYNGPEATVLFGSYPEQGNVVTVSIGTAVFEMVAIGHIGFAKNMPGMYGNGMTVLVYTGADWSAVKAAVNASSTKEVTLTAGVNKKAFPSTNIKSKRVDGLVPSFAFRVNEESGAEPSPMGTREFEVEYRSDAVDFNKDDDVERPEGAVGFGYKGDTLGAGYYEIIHTEEGSEKLIIPTTSETGIVPIGGTERSELNNTGFMFNVVPDAAMMEVGQRNLFDKAMAEIGNILADTNNYTFQSNPVAFEESNPKLTIGRKVVYRAYGYEIETRVLKLVTKVDYPFEQSITIGNKILKGANRRLSDEIAALKNDFNGWVSSGSGETVTNALVSVEYETWEQGGRYYHEDWNRYHVNGDGEWEPIIEQSYVWHYGCKWKCMKTLTTEEPWFWDCEDWQYVEGNRNLSMEFTSSRGYSFRRGSVNTVITPYLYVGNNDITGRIAAEFWSWTRETETGKTQADADWDEQHRGARTGVKTLALTDAEMPVEWSSSNKAIFTCTVTVDDGESTVIVENQVIA